MVNQCLCNVVLQGNKLNGEDEELQLLLIERVQDENENVATLALELCTGLISPMKHLKVIQHLTTLPTLRLPALNWLKNMDKNQDFQSFSVLFPLLPSKESTNAQQMNPVLELADAMCSKLKGVNVQKKNGEIDLNRIYSKIASNVLKWSELESVLSTLPDTNMNALLLLNKLLLLKLPKKFITSFGMEIIRRGCVLQFSNEITQVIEIVTFAVQQLSTNESEEVLRMLLSVKEAHFESFGIPVQLVFKHLVKSDHLEFTVHCLNSTTTSVLVQVIPTLP